jgi:hypothetical protein
LILSDKISLTIDEILDRAAFDDQEYVGVAFHVVNLAKITAG